MLSADMLERRNYFHNLGCKHTVTVRHVVAKDAYGSVTQWSDPTDYAARCEDVNRLVQASNGQMTVAAGKVVFALPSPVLDPKDEITIPIPVSPSFPSGKRKIGKIIQVKQDPTGSSLEPTVVYY